MPVHSSENLLHPIPAVHENPKFPFAFSATSLFPVMNALVYFNIVVVLRYDRYLRGVCF